jgi:hypothetical protein
MEAYLAERSDGKLVIRYDGCCEEELTYNEAIEVQEIVDNWLKKNVPVETKTSEFTNLQKFVVERRCM